MCDALNTGDHDPEVCPQQSISQGSGHRDLSGLDEGSSEGYFTLDRSTSFQILHPNRVSLINIDAQTISSMLYYNSSHRNSVQVVVCWIWGSSGFSLVVSFTARMYYGLLLKHNTPWCTSIQFNTVTGIMLSHMLCIPSWQNICLVESHTGLSFVVRLVNVVNAITSQEAGRKAARAAVASMQQWQSIEAVWEVSVAGAWEALTSNTETYQFNPHRGQKQLVCNALHIRWFT